MSIFREAQVRGYEWALSQTAHSDYNLSASHAAFWQQCLKGTELEDEIAGEANSVMLWEAWERGVWDSKVFVRDDSLLSAGEIAERTGFNISYIKAELKKGNLKGMKVGKAGYAVYPDDFREWLNNPRRGSRSKTED